MTELLADRFNKFIAGGTATGEYQYVRQNSNYNSPITDVSSNDMRFVSICAPYPLLTVYRHL
jgi:hypothetical protein